MELRGAGHGHAHGHGHGHSHAHEFAFLEDDDGIHGPDESYRLESLELGERTARELYAALADLPA